MAGSLSERLQLVVDATTGQAEAKFVKLGEASAATAKTASASAGQVAAAADLIAQARMREQQAAGQVRVAELRLQELRATGTARSSQLAAAEERLAVAQRNLAVATRQTAVASQQRATANASAVAETEALGRSTGGARAAIAGLATAGAAFVGIGLVDYLKDSVDGFLESASTASQLSISMNATVEQAGQLGALAKSIGLDFNDLLEIQAEFAQKVAASNTLLSSFGAAVKKNDDGTTNWALTLEDALIQLQKIPDATKRNALGFQLFGEEGYKQLSRLLVSGMSVKDALEAIGTPFSKDDVAAVQDYNRSMMELSLTGSRIEQTLGRALLPIVLDVAKGFGAFLDVITQIPAPISVATIAAIALGVTGFNPAAAAGGRLAVVTAALSRQFALYNAAVAIGGRATANLAASQALAGAAGRGMLAAVGGPLGAALIAASVGYTLVTRGAEAFQKSTHEAAVEAEAAEQKYGDMAASSRELGRRLIEEAGYWEKVAAARNSTANDVVSDKSLFGDADPGVGFANLISGFGDTEVAAEGASKGIDEAREALGAYGAQQEVAQAQVKGLSDMIAEGTTSGQKFADAVAAAAESQAKQAATSGLAQAAMDAYYSVTSKAVQATLDLLNAQLQQSDGLIGVQKAAYELGKTVDDAKTPWNEITEATNGAISSALSYASTAADAAVAGATAQGQIVDAAAEAKIRADATIAALRETLNAKGLTEGAKAQLTDMITQLETAKSKGDIQAILTLTGVPQAEGQLDNATKDRQATVTVESRNGPAVKSYLDGLASQTRLATVRVESRNGPAVKAYLDGLASQNRLALIRVESRNGPAVDSYLDGIAAQNRLAIIRVESRNGPAVDSYLDGIANQSRTAVINVQRNSPTGGGTSGPTGSMRGAPSAASMLGASAGGVNLAGVSLDLQLTGTLDRSQLSKASQGRVNVENIRAYERRSGTGWRSSP